jgi:hypothetical protein
LISRRDFNLWNLLLLAGIGFLLVGTVNIWWNKAGPQTQSRAGKEPAVPTAPILRDQHPLKDFEVVANKNLFSQTRSGSKPEDETEKKQETLEGRKLLGTIIVGDTKAALVANKTPKGGQASVEVVFLGEEWGGFNVVEISNEAVVFQGKDGKKTLTFPE